MHAFCSLRNRQGQKERVLEFAACLNALSGIMLSYHFQDPNSLPEVSLEELREVEISFCKTETVGNNDLTAEVILVSLKHGTIPPCI